MAKRILDLAKELNVDPAEIQRAAVRCNIAVSGPTATLTVEEQGKIRAALKPANKPAAGASSGKTLTLNRPIAAGQGHGSTVEGRGRTVEVAVRRRRVVTPGSRPAPTAEPTAPEPVAAATTPAAAPAAPATPAAAPAAPAVSPAQRAAQAVEQKKQAAAQEPQVREHAPRREGFGGERRPERRPEGRPASGPTRGAHGGGQGQSQGQQAPQSHGPRTTIRRKLTPAQIAAQRAPSSSLKEIEARISDERAERRRTG
ncbi:MAG TPA: translation initiation factor IF-2, partial [Mariprofundaceae bacterium]|nr:translation initiation factor IF-2 [Mariprofundaceae bacterium]